MRMMVWKVAADRRVETMAGVEVMHRVLMLLMVRRDHIRVCARNTMVVPEEEEEMTRLA